MQNAWILGGARTPIGKFLGAFRDTPAPELGSIVIRESLRRAALDPSDVDEVIMGNVVSAGLGQAPARQAALKAGIPATVGALTVNKVCGSGLKAVMLASQAIRLGEAEVVVAGGMENMTLSPHLVPRAREGWKMGDVQLKDAMLQDGLWCAIHDCHMGMHAEYIAEKFGLTRKDIDGYALRSQQRAARAIQEGEFRNEIVPVPIRQNKQQSTVEIDESPRLETDLEQLAKLKPAFTDDGIITAGNSSTLSDGAAAVVVASGSVAERSAAAYRARIVASYTSGTEPKELFIAPVAAIRGVLERSELEPDEIDVFEINEAFASQMLACLKELDLDPEKVNINGGAIALGHPIGASGARVLVTLLSILHRRGLRRGLASLCLGGGNAVAMIVERHGDG